MRNIDEILERIPEHENRRSSLSSEEQELAWRLREEKKFPYDAIARMIGKSKTAVYSAVQRYSQVKAGLPPTYGTHAERIAREAIRAGGSVRSFKKNGQTETTIHDRAVNMVKTEDMKKPKTYVVKKALPDNHAEAERIYHAQCERIAELEAQLQEARKEVAREKRRALQGEQARDFYNEMIDVAEKRFNIPIRKKAGTRQ